MSIISELNKAIWPGRPNPVNAWLYNSTFTEKKAFQFFPETISDSRSVSLQEKYGIGSSHPIYQWISGSAREISFDAIFTSDDSKDGVTEKENTLDVIRKVVKNPAFALFNNSPSLDTKYNQDISAAISWLRSFTYPIYNSSGRVSAPGVCGLWFEGSGIKSYALSSNSEIIPCLMTRCDVNYDAFFNNGTIRVATVSLTFVETIQVGQNWKYVNGQNFLDHAKGYAGPAASAKK